MTHISVPQISACIALLGAACTPQPPRDFVPDAGLVQQIREIRIIPQEARACPGETIHADYEAILADGSTVPFAQAYNKKQPPRLHVQFLERESPDAAARDNGDWAAERNPLATVSTGFRLTATLRANPAITSTVVLPPIYDCLEHRFSFWGSSGGPGFRGSDGPDVTVKLNVQHSPFYERLYVATIQQDGAKPVYVFADSTALAMTDWLMIESRGGDGGNGSTGSNGIDGISGTPGCPGGRGGDGANGGDGEAGGDGGSGGHITILVPPNRLELAHLVKTSSWGGSGGSGGDGGRGGAAGRGGTGLFDITTNQPCENGADGSAGRDGLRGRSGFTGSPGPRTIVASLDPTD